MILIYGNSVLNSNIAELKVVKAAYAVRLRLEIVASIIIEENHPESTLIKSNTSQLQGHTLSIASLENFPSYLAKNLLSRLDTWNCAVLPKKSSHFAILRVLTSIFPMYLQPKLQQKKLTDLIKIS